MSNTSFDFLVDSILFKEVDNEYKNVNLQNLADELNKYRKYIKKNIKSIEKEILQCDGDKILQNTQLIRTELADMNKLASMSLFVEMIVLDDPLFNIYLDEITLSRQSTFFSAGYQFDEKRKLADKVKYMKKLTPCVRCDTEYIKFYPYNINNNDYVPNKIRIPSYTYDIRTELKNWLSSNMTISNIDETGLFNNLLQYSNRIGINFMDNEGMDYFLIKFIKQGGSQEYIPSPNEYQNWLGQEKEKAIFETYNYLKSKIDLYEKFKSTLIVNNNFEKNFYLNSKHKVDESHARNYEVSLNFSGLFNIDLQRSMEIRRRNYDEFLNFQGKFKSDLRLLKTTTDEELINDFLIDLKSEYENVIANNRNKILNYNLIGNDAIVEIPIILGTYLLTKGDIRVTGAEIAGLIAKGILNQRAKKKENELYYLGKLI